MFKSILIYISPLYIGHDLNIGFYTNDIFVYFASLPWGTLQKLT